MGTLASGLHRVSSTLSWVQALLPKPPKLYPADFAHPHEIDQLLTSTWHNEAGLLLGVSPFNQVYSVRSTPERRELGNILVDAPTRGGKGLLAIAQLLTWPHSSVILDIKGELYAATAEYLRQRGHKIMVVDPRGIGNQYDPLRGKSTERELYAVAKYLLFTEGERDPIFIERGIKMLTQLFLAGREENRQAGYDKYRLLPYALQLMNVPLNQIAAHLQAISPALATKFLSGTYNPEKDYDEKKFLTSSWESADARLYPIRSDELLRCFDGSDFTGEEIITSKQPITVYLRLPESQLLALVPMIRLLFQSLINTCIDTYDNRPGRTAAEKGCYPVLFLIDEAGRAAIPKLYEYAITVVGRQISLWVAIQSIVQLEAIYGWPHAQELLENLDTKIFYRQGHATAKYLEEELDKTSKFSRSQSSRDGGYETQGLSEQAVPLVSNTRIKQMQDFEVIIRHHNLPAFWARRMNWREHPILKQRQALRPQAPPPLPPLTPIVLRSLQPVASDDLMNPDGLSRSN
ncbi:MAG: type IV secretory system conjugative DNA transfer family protein [Candidatus Tectomicrobia bacterium]|nr:type IV secretory system conjugative DNA transfer family protein [Candidatus Tectomicrobia bacterium]